MTTLTVVVPAHNEERLIGVALRALRRAPADAVEIIVVANGCRDATADRARDVSGVRVVEVAQSSKILALNAGNALATAATVAFVDADVTVDGGDLLALARRLESDPDRHVASPRMRVLPSASFWVRQYYRVWALTDYRSAGHIGSGVYLLDASGRARLGEFPDVVADDTFVQRLFAPAERLTPDDLWFAVRAPGSIAALTHRNARIAAGNRQLAAQHLHVPAASASAGARSLLARVWRRPSLWAGFVVYTAVYLTAHRRAGRMLSGTTQRIVWHRDETTRMVGS